MYPILFSIIISAIILLFSHMHFAHCRSTLQQINLHQAFCDLKSRAESKTTQIYKKNLLSQNLAKKPVEKKQGSLHRIYWHTHNAIPQINLYHLIRSQNKNDAPLYLLAAKVMENTYEEHPCYQEIEKKYQKKGSLVLLESLQKSFLSSSKPHAIQTISDLYQLEFSDPLLRSMWQTILLPTYFSDAAEYHCDLLDVFYFSLQKPQKAINLLAASYKLLQAIHPKYTKSYVLDKKEHLKKRYSSINNLSLETLFNELSEFSSIPISMMTIENQNSHNSYKQVLKKHKKTQMRYAILPDTAQ